jgi:hypothetical protein
MPPASDESLFIPDDGFIRRPDPGGAAGNFLRLRFFSQRNMLIKYIPPEDGCVTEAVFADESIFAVNGEPGT